MFILHSVLLTVFLLVGIFGLIFGIDIGVFIGMALIPWEVRVILATRGKMKPHLIKVLMAVTVVLGSGYFLLQGDWLRAGLLVGVELYMLFVIAKSQLKKSQREKEMQEAEDHLD